MNFRNLFKKKTKTEEPPEVKELGKVPEKPAPPPLESCIYDEAFRKCRECVKPGCCISCSNACAVYPAESDAAVAKCKQENERQYGSELAKTMSRPTFHDSVTLNCKMNFGEPVTAPSNPMVVIRQPPRIFKAGYPCFVNGVPCPHWRNALVIDRISKERWWCDGR